MVDTLSLLLSHGMIAFVIWRLMSLRDPEEKGVMRHKKSGWKKD